jgi:uncharacterized protein YjbI with pentapeptide repeats
MEHLLNAERSHESTTFKALTLQGEEVSGVDFYDCVFEGCAFVEVTFKDCKFVDCLFNVCDLSLACVEDSAFTNVRFESSKVIGIDWTRAYWPRIGGRQTLGFADCALNFSTFIGLDLKGIEIRNCVARDVDFSEARLVRANLRGTDFSESRFLETDLTEADFTRATNYAVDAGRNRLKRTKFSLPEAISLLRSLDIILVDPADVDADTR